MAYSTENRAEPTRITEPTRIVDKRFSTTGWLIAGAVIVAAIIGYMIFGHSTSPLSTSATPPVQNNVTVGQPAPSTPTTMDAQPAGQAPSTTITPAPAPAVAPATPEAPATKPLAPAPAPVTTP